MTMHSNVSRHALHARESNIIESTYPVQSYRSNWGSVTIWLLYEGAPEATHLWSVACIAVYKLCTYPEPGMFSPDGNPSAPLKGLSTPWRSGIGDADVIDPSVYQSTVVVTRMKTLANRLLGMLLKTAYLCVNHSSPHELKMWAHLNVKLEE